MTVEVVENCYDDVILTVWEKEGDSSTQVLEAGSPGTVWTSGRARLSRQGQELKVSLASVEHEIFMKKLLEVEFAPRIKILTVLPY